MTVISKTASTGSIQAFWETLTPASNGERPWMNYFLDNKFLQFSYKDLLAQANCTAAFLMQNGVSRGDAVMIISGPSPFYFVTDLALQYIGAVNISLPEQTDILRIGEIIRKYGIKYTFIENPDIFLGLGQLAPHKEHLNSVVLCSEEVEDMDPQKLLTFQSLINRGKSYWRENAEALIERKNSVSGKDLYCLEYNSHDENYFLDEVPFERMVTEVNRVREFSEKNGFSAVASVVPAYRLLFRTYSLYGSMVRKSPVFLMPLDYLNPGVMNQFEPSALVADADSIQALYELIPQRFMGQNSSAHKTLNSAANTYKKWDAAQEEGKKAPLMVRIRYSWLRKTLFRYINKQLGGHLKVIITGRKDVENKVSDFFRHLQIEIFNAEN